MDVELLIQNGDRLYQPVVEEGIQWTTERYGSPSILKFTVVKDGVISFQEGDPVRLKVDDQEVFYGFVFTKKRSKTGGIDVTAYDQLRYFKNKHTLRYENKTASQVIEMIANDFNLHLGTIEKTGYVIPSRVEDNTTLFDICQTALDLELQNKGELFCLFDKFGKLTLQNIASMKLDLLVDADVAEDFGYSSSIDEGTYNSIVLYYDPSSTATTAGVAAGGSASGSAGSSVSRLLQAAAAEMGTAERPLGSNRVKYNTDYYGWAVSGDSYPWCCVFVWWVFRQAGLSHLFYGGQKTAGCRAAVSWFKEKGQWVNGNYQPGDIVFFGPGGGDHVGIVERVNGNGSYTTIEGNYGNRVSRVTRGSSIYGAGRPAYGGTSAAAVNADDAPPATAVAGGANPPKQVFSAYSPETIQEWGLLRYTGSVSNPAIGKEKAEALLKLYNKKTRNLKVENCLGDLRCRAGTLPIVRLNLGDMVLSQYLLVEKAVHTFKNEQHLMSLHLRGGEFSV